MKAVFKVFLGFIFLNLFFMLFNVKAETINELQTKFLSLGGSQEAFNKIISVVQQAEKSNETLKSKINDIYDVQLYAIITADNFDANKYQQVYNNINQDKADLLSKNLSAITNLLSSLSVNDRKAYAGLLFVDMIPTDNTNSTKQIVQSTTDNNNNVQNNNNVNVSQKLGSAKTSNSNTASDTSSLNDTQQNSSSNATSDDSSLNDTQQNSSSNATSDDSSLNDTQQNSSSSTDSSLGQSMDAPLPNKN